MKCLVFLPCLVLAVSAKITQFTWSDCGASDANRAVKILELSVSPMPVKTPGDLVVHVKAQVTKSIPKWSLKLSVKRHTFVATVLVPCTENIGSCTYDGCTILGKMTTGDAAQQSVGSQVQKMLSDNNFSIACPIAVQNLDVQTFTIKVPELGKAADILADGDYTIEGRALNPDTGELYGCVHFDAAIQRSCTGWLCSGKRRRIA
ncbi:ganglioside GM2 activator-like [Haliotis rufescens]|uniref:ganglioside GM2 activator-like n=1 Tax=Haliotis rufescens TaxID=6454 RepID=UPI001EB0AB59|nr:ganglioside GM2 activator-like [Haliotis rufescens]